MGEYGHEDFTAYVVWTCERALERGLLPHTNLGVLSREDLARLREVTASQGLMLESVSERLMQTVHAGSPTKHPARRLETIRAAGELRIPFTSGILVGIGETEQERMQSLEALAAVHAEYGHIQEVILQNFVPHQSYYGEEPAEIADAAAREYWRTGVEESHTGAVSPTSDAADPDYSDPDRGSAVRKRPELPLPAWACAVSIEDMKRLIAETRRLMGDVGIQIPPNLADWWGELVQAGATDLGGLSANGDHISPEHPFPSPHQVRKQLQKDGVALTERLCVYPQYIDREWVAQGVIDTIKLKYWSFIPRHGSGRTDPPAPIRPDLVAGAIAKGRDGVGAEPRRADGAVRRDAPGGDRGAARGRRRAARGARGGDGHVRRQPQHQRLERLHRRLRVLRLRSGQALARRLRARPRGVRAARQRGDRVRRHRALHPVRHPSRLEPRGLPRLAAVREADRAGGRHRPAPARL